MKSLTQISLGLAACILLASASSAQGGGSGGKRGPGKRSAKLFAKFDTNKDGELQEAEVPAKLWTRISKLDTDGNKAVSKQEFAAAAKKRGKGGKRGKRGKGGKGGRGGSSTL